MHKVFIVGWREFRQRVKSRGFIIGSLAVPLIMIVVWVFGGAFDNGDQGTPLDDFEITEQEQMAIGYVDHADLIERLPEPIPPGRFEAFADEQAALAALEDAKIQAYYIIPEDYRQTGEIQRVSQDLEATPMDGQQFNWVLITNLFPETSDAQIRRLNWPFDTSGPQFIDLETDTRKTGEGLQMLPFIVTIAIMLPLFTSGSYLLQSVTQEKSNRIMEILLVSLKPWHILAGKLAGLGALTVIQYLIWGAIAFISLQIDGQNLSGMLESISLSASEVVIAIPYALAGYLLYAGIMAGIGAMSPNLEGSRGWVFIISLPMMIPIYLWTAIVNAPNGSFAIALSMIPFSAPVAMLMRMTSAVVPPWQLGASLVILLISAIGMIWLMSRLFRVQILLSGETLSVKRFISAIRG